jgi:hypothetical protein
MVTNFKYQLETLNTELPEGTEDKKKVQELIEKYKQIQA